MNAYLYVRCLASFSDWSAMSEVMKQTNRASCCVELERIAMIGINIISRLDGTDEGGAIEI